MRHAHAWERKRLGDEGSRHRTHPYWSDEELAYWRHHYASFRPLGTRELFLGPGHTCPPRPSLDRTPPPLALLFPTVEE